MPATRSSSQPAKRTAQSSNHSNNAGKTRGQGGKREPADGDEAHEPTSEKYPRTPDGHYFVCRDRLWRCTNPNLDEETRKSLVKDLMDARRDVGRINRQKRNDSGTGKDLADEMREARAKVQKAKEGLGERGQPWWTQGPKCDRMMIHNTDYWQWWKARSDG